MPAPKRQRLQSMCTEYALGKTDGNKKAQVTAQFITANGIEIKQYFGQQYYGSSGTLAHARGKAMKAMQKQYYVEVRA